MFYLTLLLVNIACFLPLYALNFRDAPNPIEFLFRTEKTIDRGWLKTLFSRPACTDPFRINFDFTIVMLLAASAGYSAPWLRWVSACLLAFGFLEITYSSVMHAIFKRPPAVASDLLLIKTGLSLAQRHRYWMLPAALVCLGAIAVAAYVATASLFNLLPAAGLLPLLGALLLIPPGLYAWRSYLSRAVYSPLLHFYRNLEYSRRVRAISAKDAPHFASRNHYKDVILVDRPNIVMICIESYGSLIYRDSQYSIGVADLLAEYEHELAARRYQVASTFSEPPIFAGGSWLSYASFTYGIKVADFQLFDALFNYDTSFAAYESLFHVLKRSGYSSALLCPLGGVNERSVDWTSIGRCFQSDRNFDFRSVGYRGPLVNFFGLIRGCSPPDQYSLGYGYETARKSGMEPFSLFFCTLNSHYPWESPDKAVAEWRSLDDPGASLTTRHSRNTAERYRNAIRYQLDYILRFILENADDDPLIVLFGDHQPPLLTAERMGKQTPLHVISRNTTLMSVLWNHGFAPALNLTGLEPRAIKHEGFLSLFLKGLNAAYGKSPGLEVTYRPHGVALLDEG